MPYMRAFGACAILVIASLTAGAQQPPGQGRGGGGGAGGLGAFPERPPADPATLDRGKALYGVNCQFCHGADTRGGDSGPSLLRSQLVQDDQNGELVADVLRTGRPPVMPKFDFTTAQVADIAAFLHSFTINSRDPARIRPETILTGDAVAGEAYFKVRCASCHSTTGDLKGIASKFADPRALQQWWLLPGGAGRGNRSSQVSPITATVTVGGGQKYDGRLIRIDEFIVSIVDADGMTRTFRRDGDSPKVDVHDPLKPHKDLLRTYADKDIHDVTAYLVKLR